MTVKLIIRSVLKGTYLYCKCFHFIIYKAQYNNLYAFIPICCFEKITFLEELACE